ncbi:hypothetical protein JX265_009035 [Neoarthrinium moseri]|uniref:Uncharacterized protein n=1 Tax=Neoarthrinium moseri TaxID=1658444 RepID=A0A9P9WGN3_9PEZI|nr:uncharacterized protein JN550_007905 [Neoarthrinium moseri]KAI1846662.1 hypothetical protein JX266_007235 [Neoarthrinium moseri]KAI1862989.1 hypothetical protein JX265_009035 [Neoarthrinium moseri]KAI1866216.1 hypothetical protein JN550_007905 [Neoarthrinium moseri]
MKLVCSSAAIVGFAAMAHLVSAIPMSTADPSTTAANVASATQGVADEQPLANAYSHFGDFSARCNACLNKCLSSRGYDAKCADQCFKQKIC